MSATRERVQELVDALENMRKHPFLYIEPNRNALDNFLNGVAFGCASEVAFGNNAQDNIYLQILKEYGWEERSTTVSHMMEEAGYAFETIVDETLCFNIEVLKRRYNIPDTEQKQE